MPEFEAGQVWIYETRPGEEASRVTILRVDHEPFGGAIVHVRVDDIEIQTPGAPGQVCDAVGHMPVAESAMSRSVCQLDHTVADLPPFEEGYDHWREAFDRGEAGVFDVTLAQALSYMEQALAATAS